MSNGPLPKKADPRKLAERGVQIQGCVEISALPRLVSFLSSDAGTAEATLDFTVDDQHLRTVSGQVTARVEMTCQRCLEPVQIDLSAEVKLAVVLNEEQARNLPGYYDPLLTQEEEVALWPIIEDELILTLPSIPKHASCQIQTSFGDAGTVRSEQEKPNPFSVLAGLKGKADKS
ncbi:YceD family protein [Nitrincola tapanii]|uniref:Large ribosomal RNA subunit accumulation protein YceD n=1 Tax=Nitrincola tapanii TaxID=1708751 RepID=A0A5A9W4L3_9GAMM|nr:YceD family protein [Nitrincola tapanii]KAA0875463.1 hypothetical protein E1H14_05640 [Nitrincola tapanii]